MKMELIILIFDFSTNKITKIMKNSAIISNDLNIKLKELADFVKILKERVGLIVHDE